MGSVQESIAGLKERQRARFQQLQQQQGLCERDLDLFADRLTSAAWQDAAAPAAAASAPPEAPAPASDVRTAPHAPALSACSRPQALQNKNGGMQAAPRERAGLLPEIVEFDAFAEEYGATGGWHEDDHREFLRHLRHARGDYSAAVLACCGAMLGFERLDIIAHARWHAAFEELAMRKRLAVQAWREARDVAAAAERQDAARNVATGPAPRRTDAAQCALR